MITNFLFFLITISFCFSNFDNEKLIYEINFKKFNAGEARFETKIDTLTNQAVYKITSTTKTNKFLDKFYKIRDLITLWVDYEDLSLLKAKKNIKQGNYKRKHDIAINYKESKAIFNNKEININSKVYDPISAIFFYRTLDFSKIQDYSFTSFENGKLKDISIKVYKTEIIKNSLGKFECYVLRPFSKNGKPIFKNKGQMTIWISKKEKLPIKIEQNTSVGKLTMNLKNIFIEKN
tara:strand:+ start:3488 stop:4192 length:705 start_codon:yes stop_codon:yes gene_type:complete